MSGTQRCFMLVGGHGCPFFLPRPLRGGLWAWGGCGYRVEEIVTLHRWSFLLLLGFFLPMFLYVTF